MTSSSTRIRLRILLLSVLLCALPIITVSCSGNEAAAKKTVEEFLKNQGTRDIEVDLFYVDREHPDKSYIGVTVTYNFATSEGNFQKEHLGYVLKRDGSGWAIEKNVSYTKDQSRASALIAGNK